MSGFIKKLFGTLIQKPWEKEQMVIDSLHEGKTFNLSTQKSAVIIIFGIATVLFSLVFTGYLYTLPPEQDTRYLLKPNLLWINTVILFFVAYFFGRITNFINGELWGKETNLSWGVIFPNAGSNPRHPSQLYEAGLEGLALFIILFVLVFSNGLKKRGLISGTFLFFYSFSRILVENFREPDLHIGYIFLNITMGMILSLPFLIAGLILIFQSLKNEYS